MTHSQITYEQIVPGAATVTSINNVVITPPATGATITIADGKVVTVNDTGVVALLGIANVFTADQKITGVSNPTLTLNEGNTGTDLFQIIDTSATQAQIRKISASGAALIDIDPQPSNGTSVASFRFFRSTHTSGTVAFEIYKGNNTSTINCLFAGNGNSYVQNDSGNFGIGINAPTGKAHIKQGSTTAAIPTLELEQADLSEEFINLRSTVGAGNPIDTAALGTYYGKIRVQVEGVGYKFMPLYNT